MNVVPVRRRAMLLAGLLTLAGLCGLSAATIPSDDAAIRHALSRLTFGARPGDLERVKRLGLSRWIDEQLDGRRIDDRALDTRLARYETLTLDSGRLAREYFLPARQARQAQQRKAAATPSDRDPSAPGFGMMAAPEVRRGRLPLRELTEAKLLRAAFSERQLDEVLVDFWFNHFNVFGGKGRTSIYITEYERDAIRPHVLGSFRDLLGATAKSPAMLFYLDNWMSADPNAAPPRMRLAANRQKRGLNENYGRELLELHTLGVDGGYTQKDVVDVARAFTGWTLEGQSGGFRFAPALHDRGEKHVLGHTIKAGGGIEDGEKVLDILAEHPSTARHIALELAQRFVSDMPPAALVDRAAKRFRDTHGNLRDVVRAIVTSPEFFAAEARGAKVKTPLEFVVSALRASGAEIRNPAPTLRTLQELGMMPYMCQPPTGYHDDAQSWVSSGAIVTRMNFATELASNRLGGVLLPVPAPDLGVRLGSPEFQRR